MSEILSKALAYLVICDAQLLAEFKVNEGKVTTGNPFAMQLNPFGFDISRKTGAMEAVEGFGLTLNLKMLI